VFRSLFALATDQKKGFLADCLKAVLFVLSLIYGAFIRLLIFFSRFGKVKPALKTISVGNITLGGTGKTSLVYYIALRLRESGHKAAVLSRGYKGRPGQPGDEPYMLEQKLGGLPVISGKDRVLSLSAAAALPGIDTAIIDDGFQQWKITKDLEVVCINGLMPFGNSRMIPRGILREPLSSLKRADIFVITKTNLIGGAGEIQERLARINPQAGVFEAMHLADGFYDLAGKKDISLEELKSRSLVAFSGIGDPGSFEKLLQSQGITARCLVFPDHHAYTSQDFSLILKQAEKEGADSIITTEKDAARLEGFSLPSGKRLLVLKIKIAIKDEKEFDSRLLRIYSA